MELFYFLNLTILIIHKKIKTFLILLSTLLVQFFQIIKKYKRKKLLIFFHIEVTYNILRV